MNNQKPKFITANPFTYKNIKPLRDILKKTPTKAEKIMWEKLRNKQIGFKIRRQHIIDSYITDFVCLSKKVVIEIDGDIHLTQIQEDKDRTEKLNELGYRVIRFSNDEVVKNAEKVKERIQEYLEGLKSNSI